MNLNEVEQLSREQLKNVLGGEVETTGGCCVHTEGWTQSQCDYGRDQAQEVADQLAYEHDRRMFWCCVSC